MSNMWNEISYSFDTNQVIISAPGPQGPPGPTAASVQYAVSAGQSASSLNSSSSQYAASALNSSSAAYSSSAASVVSASGIPTRWYGSFYSASTQTIANSSSAYPMILGNTDYSNSVSNNASSIVFSNTGIYNIQWSGQFRNTSNGDKDVYVWIRKNGSDYPGSTGFVAVPSAHAGVDGHTIAGWNYVISLNAGDYIQFYWGAESTAVSLQYYASATNPTRPDTVSLIVTAVQV